MKPIISHKKSVLTLFLVTYAWCMALGGFTHGMLHHLEDKQHPHTVDCLFSVFGETPADESQHPSREPGLFQTRCAFLAGLHTLLNTSIGFEGILTSLGLIFNQMPLAPQEPNVFVIATCYSSHQPRAPPPFSLS